MSIPALRTGLSEAFGSSSCVVEHPGLTLYRYHESIDVKSEHLEREKVIRLLTQSLPDKTLTLYKAAYERWQKMLQEDSTWVVQRRLTAADRLFIGLGGASVLEFGVTLHHVYGLPCIPGSSLKGICSEYASAAWGQVEDDWSHGNPLHKTMFGCSDDPEKGLSGNAGAMDFLDAWWIPDLKTPFVEEIINPHHPDYYVSTNPTPPADWDQPVPIKMMAVTGSFLFAVRGPAGWNELAMELLMEALARRGAGGKTRAGYGRFKVPTPSADAPLVWKKAHLQFQRKDNTLLATLVQGNKRSTAVGKVAEVVGVNPESKLFKNKPISADVEVLPQGNNFKLVKILG